MNKHTPTQRPMIDHDPIKPWQWATLPCRQDPVEIVSYPLPGEGGLWDTIMVRMTVGDPTSSKEVPLKAIACFSPDRHEWFERERIYYSDNPTAFHFADELARAALKAAEREGG